jgi:hypothetical protein
MRRAHRSGAGGRATLGVALLTALLGCGSDVHGQAFHAGLEVAKPTVPPAVPGSLDPAEPPLVGTCWTLPEGRTSTPLHQPDPASCSTGHGAETAAVGHSGLADDAPYPTPADLDDPRSPISRALAELCDLDVVREYLGGDSLDAPYAGFAPHLPAADQWAAGARWIRCDVFHGHRTPEPAPGVLAGALRGDDAARHRSCLAGSATDHTVVPCSEPHEAEPVGTEVADLPEGSSHPDEATRLSAAHSCTEVAEDYGGGEVPHGYVVEVWTDTPGEWSEHPHGRCVLVPAGGGRTATSVRA